MQALFDAALARLDRAEARHREFGQEWAAYTLAHPWDIDVVGMGNCTYEVFVVMRDPAPQVLSMIFSEWLATLRAALDNGFYAWVADATHQNPPPQAERLQFPICTTPQDLIEMEQPYQSPYGPRSNLLYWLNELARTDRHRSPHVGLGRTAQHKVRIGVPEGEFAVFDESIKPYNFIDGRHLVARFTTTRERQAGADVCGLTQTCAVVANCHHRATCGFAPTCRAVTAGSLPASGLIRAVAVVPIWHHRVTWGSTEPPMRHWSVPALENKPDKYGQVHADQCADTVAGHCSRRRSSDGSS